MKLIIPFISILFLIGCNKHSRIEPTINYSGYYIWVEGGRMKMELDSITPLNKLIPRLRNHNVLYETHKAYLIGFNDLMFSIAVHSDEAIESLKNYIDTTSSYNAKMAAIYTLYLAGINCNVEHSPYEDFTNIRARDALFKILAEDTVMQMQIMLLLIRDPRESDVPKLFNILETSTSDCWPIISGLLRYNLINIPVKQDIPDSLYSMKIKLPRQTNNESYRTIGEVFSIFAQKYPNQIQIEDTLFHYDELWYNENEIYIRHLTNLHVGPSFIGANFQYFYKDGIIHFCSALTAKHLWLDWWNSQSSSYKDSLNKGYKKIGINRV